MNSELSVVMITRNAESTLDQALSSVRGLTHDIVVVDDFSTDRTVEIARGHGARITQRKLEGFGAQKQSALDLAKNTWVFVLDSDEEVEPALALSIQKALRDPAPRAAYRVARKNLYFGQWLRFGGKYPDYQTRLIHRAACRFSSDVVHEKIVVNGVVGVLSGNLRHHTYPDMETWRRKLDLFARYRGEELFAKGLRPSLFNAAMFCVARPAWRFVRRFLFKFGFLDGRAGFLACVHDALTDIRGYQVLKKKAEGAL